MLTETQRKGNSRRVLKHYYGHKEELLKARKQKVREERKKALELFGSLCLFCDEKRERFLQFHKKDGSKHWGRTAFYVLKNPSEWVLLCFYCHRGVHWCMRRLNMTWKDIENKFLRRF